MLILLAHWKDLYQLQGCQVGLAADLSSVFLALGKTECSRVGEKQKDQSPMVKLDHDDHLLYPRPT